MTKITLTNDFHNTEINLVAKQNSKGVLYFSKSQCQKAQRTLCGIKGCGCSGVLGTRGSQQITEQNEKYDGSVEFYLNN